MLTSTTEAHPTLQEPGTSFHFQVLLNACLIIIFGITQTATLADCLPQILQKYQDVMMPNI